ncbi:MAG: chemotaxis protein CheA [Sphingomonas sp.]
MTNEEIQEIFFVECEEALAAAEGGLDDCRAGTHTPDTINSIFRAVHSIKGGAGAFGFAALQHFTHGFETLLSDVRDETVPITDPLIGLMLRALDTLGDHVAAARDGGAAPDDAALIAELAVAQAGNEQAPETPEVAAPVMPTASAAPDTDAGTSDDDAFDMDFDLDGMLDAIATDEGFEGADEAGYWHVAVHPRDDALDNGGEPILLMRELLRLGGKCVSCDASKVPMLDKFNADHAYLSWEFQVPASVAKAAIEEVFDFSGDDCAPVITLVGTEQNGEGSATPDAGACADEAVVSLQLVTPPAPVVVPAPVVAVPVDATPVVAPSSSSSPASAAQAPPPAEPSPVAAAPKAAAAAAPAATTVSQSIRIDLARLDRLIDSVGELVIAQAMLAQRLSTYNLAGIEELAMLDGLTRDIQEGAMGIRAQPIGSVFSRVPRMLRELEGTTGKAVKLEMSGEATELDKTVIERLGEPLTHLIRNAVDHGIESGEERLAAGKPEQGTLHLSAEHRGGRILIKVSDDGKGIDRARVFNKAVEKGLIAAEAHLSDEEIDNLIFAPGFSTAAVVSNVSGRGVGMDVVRQNVKDLGGRITIESVPGKGSTFTLALPLTLAISDGMIVTVGDQTLVVPLAHVVESLRPQGSEVAKLGSLRQMLNVRGQFIPILPIEHAVGARGAVTSPHEGVLIVVDTETAGQAALLVDEICDQRQFVIKSLDTHYRAVNGVAGATILGDGRVALILDVDGLVANAVVSTGPLAEAA